MEYTEIFLNKPDHFTPNILVAGGFLQHENRFLLLQRHPEKSYGLHWNLPAGKVESKEDPHLAAQREIFEETGILISLEHLKPLHTFYIKRAPFLIQFHVYQHQFLEKPKIDLKLDENVQAEWLCHEEAQRLPLIGGGNEIITTCLKKIK